jgi:hypothetical protein
MMIRKHHANEGFSFAAPAPKKVFWFYGCKRDLFWIYRERYPCSFPETDAADSRIPDYRNNAGHTSPAPDHRIQVRTSVDART